ncbi:MAG TPA: PhnD/SsuA/transferrin family substrate-binding protein [Myxococcota bacterium]|nr:PhnD/SsuA/transferrin family substrate-binding protein [Myxococcota bacterium]
MSDSFLLGAVAYDPKVVTIWEGFKDWFDRHGLPFDYILYTHYERQVEAQLRGDVHVAWNSPLAWIQTERLAQRLGRQARAFAMRDSDRDLRSVVLVRTDSPFRSPGDLVGQKIGVGAGDSPQATLIPLYHLQQAGLRVGQDLTVVRHDRLLGKHGDHIGGERDAVRSLLTGQVAAACILDGNLLQFSAEGTIPSGSLRVLTHTAPYDHCVFTVLDGVPEGPLATFTRLLLQMDYGDPEVRPLLELEGLKQWKEGRTSGFAQLQGAVDAFGTVEPWLSAAEARLRG